MDKNAAYFEHLSSYPKALKYKPTPGHPFPKGYIDAYAGTGYRDAHRDDEPSLSLLFPDLPESEPQDLLDGSARLALKTEPCFDKYIFIDRSPKACTQLEALKGQFACSGYLLA